MNDVEVTTHGDFQVATARGTSGFLSWAKMGIIQTDCPIKEPGNYVWINHGKTRKEARNCIIDELGLLNTTVLQDRRTDMNDQDFLQKLKEYIEEHEALAEGEWGYSQPLEKLIKQEDMPEIYNEVVRRLAAL